MLIALDSTSFLRGWSQVHLYSGMSVPKQWDHLYTLMTYLLQNFQQPGSNEQIQSRSFADGNLTETALDIPHLILPLLVKIIIWDFLGGNSSKNPPANAGDTDSIPGPGRLDWL